MKPKLCFWAALSVWVERERVRNGGERPHSFVLGRILTNGISLSRKSDNQRYESQAGFPPKLSRTKVERSLLCSQRAGAAGWGIRSVR